MRVMLWFACMSALAVGLPAAAAGGGLSTGSTSPTSGKQRWVSRYDGPANGSDGARALGLSPDGSRVFVTGRSEDDYATIAYDADGVQLWVRRHGGIGNALRVSPDGARVFVTGGRVTIAYDPATGARLWLSSFPGVQADALAVSGNGSTVFVTGWSSGTTHDDYATVAYDAATGAQLWVQRYDEAGAYEQATDIGVSPDGSKLFVTGSSTVDFYATHWATVAYDAATGAQLWVKRFDGADGESTPHALGVSPDGSRVFVTGEGGTIVYDASGGGRLWGKAYPGANAWALAVAPDGAKVFVTGAGATVAYDAATGARLWTAPFEGPRHQSGGGNAIGVSPDGSKVFASGGTGSRDNSNYTTLAHDAATGAELWVKNYDAPGKGLGGVFPHALAVSPDGASVYVTGSSLESASYDYATVAYSTG